MVLSNKYPMNRWKKYPKIRAKTGVNIQHEKILNNFEKSAVPESIPAPITAPIIAWEAEAGMAKKVRMAMVTAAARAQQNASAGRSRERSLTVSIHFGPSIREPINTNIPVSRTAVLYLMTPVVTPVPKILAESLAPRPQPRKIPLVIFHMTAIPLSAGLCYLIA